MRRLFIFFFLTVAGLHALRAAESASTPMLRIEAGMHTSSINRLGVDATARLVLTAGEDKTARLWELPGGRLLRVLRPPLGEGNEGKLFAGALSPDGSLAAVGGWTKGVYEGAASHNIYLFDTATGRMVRRLSGLPNVVFDLAFSAQGRFLAATLYGGNGLRVWETATGREVARDTEYGGRDSYGVDWHGEDRLVTACYDGQVRLYRMAAGPSTGSGPAGTGGGKLTLLKKSAIKGGKEAHTARFSRDGRQIVVGFNDSTAVTVVDGSDLSFLLAPSTAGVSNGELSSVTWTDDGAEVAAGGRWAPSGNNFTMRRWAQAGRGNVRDTAASGSTIMDLRPLPGGGILYCAFDPAWGIINPDGSRRLLGEPPLADFPAGGNNFGVSADSTVVFSGYDQFGKEPLRFSVGARQLELLKPGAMPAGLRAPRMEGLAVTDWKNSTAPKLAGKPLVLDRYENARSLAIAADASSFLLGASWYLRSYTAAGELRWKLSAAGIAWAVNLAGDDRLAVVAYGDGTLRWHRYDNGRELLAFFPHADRKRWVLWTPQGYYDCSPGAEELIGWHVNRGKDEAADFFPAAKFRDQFYRPDVIQLVLAKGDVTAALKAANETAGRKAQPAVSTDTVIARMAPPVVELAVGGARGEVSVGAEAKSFTVRYRVRRGGGEAVTRVRLLVDGRPVPADAPIPGSDTAEASVEAPLPADRDCVLTVLAEHRFAVSEPATLRIVRGGSCTPHYDGEPGRRASFHSFIQQGALPAGYALDDGAAAHFVGDTLARVVTSRPSARAFHVRREGGAIIEEPLPTQFLEPGNDPKP